MIEKKFEQFKEKKIVNLKIQKILKFGKNEEKNLIKKYYIKNEQKVSNKQK